MTDSEPFYVETRITDQNGDWTVFGKHITGARCLVKYLMISFPNEKILALHTLESEEAWRQKVRQP